MVRPSRAKALVTPNAPCKPVERVGQVGVCAFGVAESKATMTVALIGDSHAVHWRAAVDQVARANGWHGVSLHQTGCPLSKATKKLREPLFSECIRWNAEVYGWLAGHPEVNVVFTSALVSRTGVVRRAGRTEFDTAVEGYADAWAALPPSVTSVVVIRDDPNVGKRAIDCVERATRARRAAGVACAVRRRTALKPDPAAVAVRRLHPQRVHLVDLSRLFCGRRRCFPVIGGALVYKDGNHLTRVFAATLGPILRRRVARISPPR
jgi:hypothetical protein